MIIIFLLLFIFSCVFTLFWGYWSHKIMHSNIIPFISYAHNDHHYEQYPIRDLISLKYRDSGRNNSTYYFILLFSPYIAIMLLLCFFSTTGFLMGVSLFIGMVITGLLNDKIHEAFHLHDSIWHSFPGFRRLQMLHFMHHYRTNSNMGIFFMGFDRLFGTFQDTHN